MKINRRNSAKGKYLNLYKYVDAARKTHDSKTRVVAYSNVHDCLKSMFYSTEANSAALRGFRKAQVFAGALRWIVSIRFLGEGGVLRYAHPSEDLVRDTDPRCVSGFDLEAATSKLLVYDEIFVVIAPQPIK